MSDDSRRPDDVVEGFDLPGGDPTPPPEDETPPDEGGTFDLPGVEGVAAGGVPSPSTPLAEGFDLPGPGPVPPPAMDATATVPATPARRPGTHRRPSVMGKFIALIVIPIVAIPVILYVMSRKKEEAESYKADYVATAQRYIELLSDARAAGNTDEGADLFLKATGLLSETLRRGSDPQDLDDHFRKVTAGKGPFVELVDVAWEEPPPGTPYTTFAAAARFESGTVDVTFTLGGIDKSIRIKSYTLGGAAKSRPDGVQQVFPYEREYTSAVSGFLKELSGGGTEAAHAMLSTVLAEKVDAAKLSDDFRKAAGSLGNFSSLEDAKWDPVVARQSASFRARAVFEKGSVEVWFRVRGMMNIQIAEYRFGGKS